MKTIERVIALLGIIAIVMIYTNGSKILFTFTTILIPFCLYVTGFLGFKNVSVKQIFSKNSYPKLKVIEKVSVILLGVGACFLFPGILFRIQHWPYSHPYLILGATLMIIVGIISLVQIVKHKNAIHISIIIRIGFITLFLLATSPLLVQA